MRKLFSYAVATALFAVPLSAAQSVAKKKAPATTAHKKTVATKSTTHRAATAPRTKGKAALASTRRSKPATTWRNRQLSPTPDRYKDIQTALASRGYLSQDEVNGTWGPSSVEALKKFQAEQNIDGGGKLNSLSIIALGLGPKHDSAVSLPQKPQ